MNESIISALQLIISRSPRAGESAVQCIFAAQRNSPVLQARYNQVVMMALADPEATFTPAERELIAAGFGEPETMGEVVRLRLSASEKDRLRLAADQAGKTMSDYIRSKIFPPAN